MEAFLFPKTQAGFGAGIQLVRQGVYSGSSAISAGVGTGTGTGTGALNLNPAPAPDSQLGVGATHFWTARCNPDYYRKIVDHVKGATNGKLNWP